VTARIALMLQIFGLCFRTRPVATGIVVVIMIIEAVAATVLAVVQGFLIEHAPQGLDRGVIGVVVVGAVFVALTIVADRAIYTLQRDVAEAVELTLIDDLLGWTTRPATVEHLQDPLFLDRLSVVVRRTQGLAHAVWAGALMLSSFASVVVSLTVLGRIHPVLVGLAALSVPPIILAGRAGDLYMKAVDKNAELLRLDEQLTAVATGTGSLKEILVAGSGPRLDERARRLWDEMAAHEFRARGLAVLLTSLGWLIYGVGAAGAVWWTIELTRVGAATIGDVGVVAGLAVFLAQQIMNVLNFRIQVADAGRVIDHYGWIRDQTAALAGPDEPLSGIEDALVLDRVEYSYPGRDRPSVDDISVTIPAGTVLGVVGINGAGKSTLAKILTGLLEPSSGRLLVDGRPVGPGSLTGATAGTFQDYAQLELLAWEAVGVADLDRARDSAELDRAAVAGGAASVVSRLADGWQTQLGAVFDGAQLSQGQWQRLALARGLFKRHPTILVLDEPTAALDAQSEHDLFAAFAERSRTLRAYNGAVTILVSHRFSTVTMTDLILVLDGGRLVEHGSHAELVAAGGTYRALYEAQARGYADTEDTAAIHRVDKSG
jgi:ATP-binding cassette subfamily B protein